MNEEPPIVKVCHTCDECLPINCFVMLPHRNGYFNICKQCASKYYLKRFELLRQKNV